MKKIFALTLVLVLAIGASAMAATSLTTSGRVRFFTDDVFADEIAWGNDFRLNFAGTVSETAGFQVRFDKGDVVNKVYAVEVESTEVPHDEAKDTYKVGTTGAPTMSRANYWVKTPVGKVVVGKQLEDYSVLGINYTSENLLASFTGVGVYPTIAEGVTAFGFWNPSAKQFGAQAKVAVAGATVVGGISKADADEDMALAIGASYPVIADKLTVYGQFDKKGDVDEKFIGASTTVAGIEVAAEYKLEAETIALDFTKAIGGVEFNSTWEKVGDADATLTLYTTLAF